MAAAALLAFMGLSLAGPVLRTISDHFSAEASTMTWLYSGYFLATALTLWVSSWLASVIGQRWVAVLGLFVIGAAATLCYFAQSVPQLIAFRAMWGSGTALFLGTALTIMVGASASGSRSATVLYETALGVGMATGPILGAVSGSLNWRTPFMIAAVAVCLAGVAIAVVVRVKSPGSSAVSLRSPVQALRSPTVRGLSIIALLYNVGFFTVIGVGPIALVGMTPMEIGVVYCLWGVCFAVVSVVLSNPLRRVLGVARLLRTFIVLFTISLAGVCVALACDAPTRVTAAALISTSIGAGVIGGGLSAGVMQVRGMPYAVAVSGYNIVRWGGGALGPIVGGLLAQLTGSYAPAFCIAALAACGAVAMSFAHKPSSAVLARGIAQAPVP